MLPLYKLLAEHGFVVSEAQAKRYMTAGIVYVDQIQVTDPRVCLVPGLPRFIELRGKNPISKLVTITEDK